MFACMMRDVYFWQKEEGEHFSQESTSASTSQSAEMKTQ